MAVSDSNTNSHQAPKDSQPWTKEEELQLLHLRNNEKLPYATIAQIHARTIQAVTTHIYFMNKRDNTPKVPLPKPSQRTRPPPTYHYATVDWTDELDTAIIAGHRNRKNNRAIVNSLHVPRIAVQERWTYLKSNGLVPADVLALDGRRRPGPRGKTTADWRREEDEAIWGLWNAMKTDKEIVALFPFEGRSCTAIKTRRVALVNVTGLYGNGPAGMAWKEGRPVGGGNEKEEEEEEDGKAGDGEIGAALGEDCGSLGEKMGSANKGVVKGYEGQEGKDARMLGKQCLGQKQEVGVDKVGISEEEWMIAICGASSAMDL
ncbi:hypothetical protein J1614_001784 [Plenodomus biglobosus]|nr:hypothetical protein J1614_001784 [Plenodomus biglobosus]